MLTGSPALVGIAMQLTMPRRLSGTNPPIFGTIMCHKTSIYPCVQHAVVVSSKAQVVDLLRSFYQSYFQRSYHYSINPSATATLNFTGMFSFLPHLHDDGS